MIKIKLVEDTGSERRSLNIQMPYPPRIGETIELHAGSVQGRFKVVDIIHNRVSMRDWEASVVVHQMRLF